MRFTVLHGKTNKFVRIKILHNTYFLYNFVIKFNIKRNEN
jgi:hypothetical protein